MNNNDAAFLFELSPAELHWLAGAAAIHYLPLPEDPSRFLRVDEWKSQLAQAPASLQARGFLAGWHVDRLPGAVVRWLGSARKMLRLETQSSVGGRQCTHYFLDRDAGLQIRLVENIYELVLFRDCNAMIDRCLDDLGLLQTGPVDARKTYALPQPRTIIGAAWKDPSLAAKMLKVSRSKPEDVEAVLAWAGTLEWVAELSQIQLDGEEAKIQNKSVLCGNRQNAWKGEVAGTVDEATFSCIDLEGIRAVLQQLF